MKTANALEPYRSRRGKLPYGVYLHLEQFPCRCTLYKEQV